MPVESVRLRPAVNSIQGIVNSYVHHGVHTRFVKWVVVWSYAGRGGGRASVCVPKGDCVAAGRCCECGLSLRSGHKGHDTTRHETNRPALAVHNVPPLSGVCFTLWVSDFMVFTTVGMCPHPAAAFAMIASVISDTLHGLDRVQPVGYL